MMVFDREYKNGYTAGYKVGRPFNVTVHNFSFVDYILLL